MRAGLGKTKKARKVNRVSPRGVGCHYLNKTNESSTKRARIQLRERGNQKTESKLLIPTLKREDTKKNTHKGAKQGASRTER